MQYLKTEQELNNDKIGRLFDCIKTACEMVHACLDAKKKAEKAEQVLKSEDKIKLWNVLQEYLREYADFINGVSGLTRVGVYKVDKDYFNLITVNDIKQQIKGVISFVYLKKVWYSTAKGTFEQCLKSLFKRNKLFSK